MIIIVDYGMGNLRSIQKALVRQEVESQISSEPDRIAAATKLVLPGVGHFARGMQNLRQMGLLDALRHAVLCRGAAILGICLGMQLFCRHSEEGEVDGLGWLDAEVVRFRVHDQIKYKIPHIGWNSVRVRRRHPVFSQLREGHLFYFVHSYHIHSHDPADVVGLTTYDYEFTSAVHRDNIVGTQFHPEKSRDIGLQILKSFAERM